MNCDGVAIYHGLFDLLLNFYTVLPLQVEAEEIDLGFEVKIIHRTSSLDNSIPS